MMQIFKQLTIQLGLRNFNMSSKKAMKQAQKQAFAKHRSNIVNSRFKLKNKNLINKKNKKN